mmetsp:Transcript_14774/g.42336  ORF Transcript_14774/g.42336 Transcript_14774/m.42336 type:complete len:338 (-) Transcript_14774:2195-3208(-)
MRHLDRLKVAAGELRRDRLADGDHERPSLRLARDAAAVRLWQAPHRGRGARRGGDDRVDRQQDGVADAAADVDRHVERGQQRLELLPHAGRVGAHVEKVGVPVSRAERAGQWSHTQVAGHRCGVDAPPQRRLLCASDVEEQRAGGPLVLGRLGELHHDVGHAGPRAVEDGDVRREARRQAAKLGQNGCQPTVRRARGGHVWRLAAARGGREPAPAHDRLIGADSQRGAHGRVGVAARRPLPTQDEGLDLRGAPPHLARRRHPRAQRKEPDSGRRRLRGRERDLANYAVVVGKGGGLGRERRGCVGSLLPPAVHVDRGVACRAASELHVHPHRQQLSA